MKKQKITETAGLPGTVSGDLAALLAGDYATGVGLAGAAVAGVPAGPEESEVTP